MAFSSSSSLRFTFSALCFLSISGASGCNFRETMKIPSHRFFERRRLLLAEERSNYYSKASSWWRGKKEDRTGAENKRLKRSTRQSLTLKKKLCRSVRAGVDVRQLGKLNGSSETLLNLFLQSFQDLYRIKNPQWREHFMCVCSARKYK